MEASTGASSAAQVRAQMDAATSEEEAAATLTAVFASKLESVLQMSAGSLNVESSLLEVGIDSLLAVEIRTWFLKEAHVDVPVLKVLGGDNARDICTDAAKKYLSAKMKEDNTRASDLEKLKLDTEHENLQSDIPGVGKSSSPSESVNGGSTNPINSDASTPTTDMDHSTSSTENDPPMDTTRVAKLSFAQSR
jgi:aryl carrier-like protein